MMLWLGTFIIGAYRDLQVHSVAETGSTFVHGFLAPYAQDYLAYADRGSGIEARLAEVAERSTMLDGFGALRIWATDGSLIYPDPGTAAELGLEADDVLAAAQGQPIAELTTERHANSHSPIPVPYTEVYAPIHDPASGRIVAVGEIYQDASELLADRSAVERSVWGAILLATAGLLLTLALSVRQSAQLRANLARERLVTEQNAVLRREAEEARAESSLINEQVLNLVGAELHDGPIQILGLAALMEGKPGSAALSGGVTTRSLLADVVHQLRVMADGLILPELKGLPPSEVVHLATARHAALTGTAVAPDIGPLPVSIDEPRAICLYRIVQEGLTNAYRHAGGKGQSLSCRLAGEAIQVRIENEVDAAAALPATPSSPGLGQRGMRRRLDVFGGTFTFERREGRATLTAVLPI